MKLQVNGVRQTRGFNVMSLLVIYYSLNAKSMDYFGAGESLSHTLWHRSMGSAQDAA